MLDPNSKEFFNLIQKVNNLFYEKIYDDSWLSRIFDGVGREHIESQQTDFIVAAFGGPKKYSGRNPKDAHPHIFIQEDMWELREKYLTEAFEELNISEEIRTKWLKIDHAFKSAILKDSISECFGRFKTEPIINIPNPHKKSAA